MGSADSGGFCYRGSPNRKGSITTPQPKNPEKDIKAEKSKKPETMRKIGWQQNPNALHRSHPKKTLFCKNRFTHKPRERKKKRRQRGRMRLLIRART